MGDNNNRSGGKPRVEISGKSSYQEQRYFPPLPKLPDLPPMPVFGQFNYESWVKDWENCVRKWEDDVDQYFMETERWYDENYNTRTYAENGYIFHEAISKDGRVKILSKMKLNSYDNYSKTVIWMDGEKVYESATEERSRFEPGTVTRETAAVRTPTVTRTTRSTNSRRYTSSKRTTRATTSAPYSYDYYLKEEKRMVRKGCCGCLIIMLIMIAIIIFAVIGVISVIF